MMQKNMAKTNALMKLGGNLDVEIKGKAQIKGSKAAQKALPECYFPIDRAAKLPMPTNCEKFTEHNPADIQISNTLDEDTLKREA